MKTIKRTLVLFPLVWIFWELFASFVMVNRVSAGIRTHKNEPRGVVEYMKIQERDIVKIDLAQEWLTRIVECESHGNPLAINSTVIVHCQTDAGYHVETNKCTGGVEVYREQASGAAQILPSSWKRWGCEGDIFNYDDNTTCALKAYEMGRAGEWMCK